MKLLFENWREYLKEGFSLVGNCTEFDTETGACEIPQLPYADATQLAYADENAKEITREEFVAAVGGEVEVKEPYYLYDVENDIYMILDGDKDIHYFYVRTRL